MRIKMKNLKLKICAVATNLFLSGLLIRVASAAYDPNKPLEKPVTSFQQLIDLIERAARWFLGGIIAIAVVFLLYAAFLYLTAGGNDEKVKQAKNIIIYVVVAIIVALVAAGVVNIVQNFIGVSTT